jgi:hypothetical protein
MYPKIARCQPHEVVIFHVEVDTCILIEPGVPDGVGRGMPSVFVPRGHELPHCLSFHQQRPKVTMSPESV